LATGDYGYASRDASIRAGGAGAATLSPEVLGGSTRYDLPLPVTIPDDSTSMVMVFSHPVKGEEIFLFSPDGRIPASADHPFRAVRFVNDTGGELEPGPIAMFQKGAFLGQAVLEAVPAGASATLPFALDRAIAVETETRNDASAVTGERVVMIGAGQLSIRTEKGTRTVYHVRNGSDFPAKIIVKHRLAEGAKLFAPPPGTEERSGAGTALVPATVAAHEKTDLPIDERSGEVGPADWFGDAAGQAVRSYLADPKSDAETVRKLSVAWASREDAVRKTRERDHLRQQSYDLQQETDELRRNLKAAGGGSGDALRAKLGNRLAQAMAQIADFDKKIVVLDAAISESTDRFRRDVEDIHVLP
jgi:hypothetical protein